MAERREASADAVMTRIGQAVILLHGGDREEARNRFGELWSEIGESGDALHRCTLAHYLADTQDDPGDELAWDLRALTAADGPTGDGGAGPEGGGAAAGMGPIGPEDGARPGGGAGGARPRAAGAESEALRALYPSLHLNLAEDYVKLQRPDAARVHLDRARRAADALGGAGCGHGVRAGIDRLERWLRET
ncbi:hypothetical protein [Streptomyces hebeiensis]